MDIQHYLSSGTVDILPLLSLVLNKSTAELMADVDYTLTGYEKNKLERLIQQRQNGMPFAYLSGSKGFYHLDFKVSPDTLIPRPETELLIDIALDLFKPNQACDLLDLGTGSGVIAITLADKNPEWKVSAVDCSAAALVIAKQNATNYIDFQQGDWFEAVAHKSFDLIIANPPYIAQNDPHLKQLSYEPQSALIAGKDGLDDIRIIIKDAPKHLKQLGYLLLEHGYNQQAKIVKLLKENFTHIQTFNDYNSNQRAVLARLKP